MSARYLFTKPRWQPTASGVLIPSTKSAWAGANIHIKYGDGTTVVSNYPQNQTPSTYVAFAQDLGIKWYRTNITTAQDAVKAQPYFTAFRAAGIEPFVVINAEPASFTVSYATNYSLGLSLGQAIGQALAGYCVYVETSNEIDKYVRIDKLAGAKRADGSSVDGSQRSDFNDTWLNAFCGWNSGVAAGLRQYISGVKIGYAPGTGFGAYIVGEMWQKGIDTNGNVVRAPEPVDYQSFHWYTSMANPQSATPSGGTALNIFQECYRRMGVPMFITEWGSSITDAPTAALQASQLTSRAHSFWDTHANDHIAGAFFYGLFPNPAEEGDNDTTNWGLVQKDGITIKPSYTAFKSFIAT